MLHFVYHMILICDFVIKKYNTEFKYMKSSNLNE